MTPKIRLLPLLILILFATTSCMGETETFIQGTWRFDNPHLRTIVAEKYLTTTWDFHGGTYYYRACCFNIDLEMTGRYRILNVRENEITLELFDSRGSEYSFNTEIRLVLDRTNGTLQIMGDGPYILILP